MTENNNHSEEPQNPELVKENGRNTTEKSRLVLAREIMPFHLPIVPVSNHPFFPRMTVPMVIENENLKKMIVNTAKSNTKFVGLVMRQLNEDNEHNEHGDTIDLYSVGVVAEIFQILQSGENSPVQVLLGVQERIKIVKIIQKEPHIIAQIDYMLESRTEPSQEIKAYSIAVVKSIKELIQLNPLHKEELSLFLSHSSLSEPGRLADFSAALTTASGKELQEILETINITNRLMKVLALLQKEIDISKLQARITKRIEKTMSKQQREFFLREQLKAIKKELGLAKEGKDSEVERMEERLKTLVLTEEAKERIDDEMEKFKLLEQSSPEFNVSRTYLDWLTGLPWGIFTKDNYDIKKASRILDNDHYGLDDVKDRILEFLAVGVLKGNISGSILCFVGPPGVGKTSIGQSIARSIGRKFFRFSVGGIQDEAEIKGHRRTYIGALPGKFIQAIKTCKSANPVIMLDEIDKIGASYRGDPASALLEVLDPEQNRDFLDHYLDVRFDLSNVFFICTANQLDTIPRPLLDRMEIINLAGYILEEKIQIAKKFLIPKQMMAHGADKKDIKINTKALREIIDGYAREPGVRGLENAIKKIIRKSVKQIVEGKKKHFHIDAGNVSSLIGKRVFTEDILLKKPRTGVVTGLAWTNMGGDLIFVEATKVETDKSGFKQTGQLGNVMIESSEIAYTYIRSILDKDEKARNFFRNNFIHLHVPAGATPKDGPSAGITMASSLYSLAINKPIKEGFAMTGELTLTGLVMPIGGLKEKTIAAKRARLTKLVFPSANKNDFDELPDHIKKGIKPFYVTTFKDVINICF